jgi:hypothetical protein
MVLPCSETGSDAVRVLELHTTLCELVCVCCTCVRCSGKATSGPGLRSLMDVTQFVSRKKEMMRVFVNRSARQRDHAAVGGKQLRRCGSASTIQYRILR